MKVILIRAPDIDESKPGTIQWKAQNSGQFSVSSLYNLHLKDLGILDPTLKLIWSNVVSPRVRSCGWLAFLEIVKTGQLFLILGIFNDQNLALCKLCGTELESTDHLSLWCHKFWKIWSDCLKWWGVQWVTPKLVRDLLIWWQGRNHKDLKNLIWNAIPMTVLWTMCGVRNNSIFENVQPKWEETLDLIKYRVAFGVNMNGVPINYTVEDIVFRVQSTGHA